ncbi:hypothetical protein BH20ACT14_BH20ACT14_16000 [soil metagenome]
MTGGAERPAVLVLSYAVVPSELRVEVNLEALVLL